MMLFNLPTALALLGVLETIEAHTLLSKIWVDGESQNDGTCIRMNTNNLQANYPIPDWSSTDMACGIDGQKGVARVCPAKAGSQLTFEFRERGDTYQGRPIDPSHKGTCAIYMKKVESAIKSTGAGDGWFKVWDEGYDENAGKWCTEKLIADQGHLSVNIPSDIAGGYYLVRTEVLALHAAKYDPPNPQIFVNCAQLYIESSGNAEPGKFVSIPGYASKSDPGVDYQVWGQDLKLPYPNIGPPAYKSTQRRDLSIRAESGQTEGFCPPNTVIENANWCGTEVAKFNTIQGCWATSQDCWAKLNDCFSNHPATGYANCRIWQQRCEETNNICNSGTYIGPADHGKVLTPKANDPFQLPAPRPGTGAKASAGKLMARKAHGRAMRRPVMRRAT
ncbi:MAG: hypothetical protein M1837_006236 [Sclerophora amabilis]|nr:MAG: hypothetical protein M1837_006236 [Sclerophora amabilis]